jgi:hypothetical protein
MQYSKRGIPGILSKLEETMGVMYKKWRRVLQRGQSPVAPKGVKKRFNHLTPELNPSEQGCLPEFFYWGFKF